VAALLTFEQGQVATLVTSFDVQATRTPHLEVYGTDATLVLPDPNFYDGVVSCAAAATGAGGSYRPGDRPRRPPGSRHRHPAAGALASSTSPALYATTTSSAPPASLATTCST